MLPQSPRYFLLKTMPPGSRCAEIGVHLGDFSQSILDIVRPQQLHLIDPWRYETGAAYARSKYGGKRGMSQAHMDKRYRRVLTRFTSEVASGRVVLHRGYSHEVCATFADGYFDWVYIDGNHLYEFVKKDLERYYSKIKQGGFLTGDDYGVADWWEDGVTRAVDEFVANNRVTVVEIRNGQFILQKNLGHDELD
jgi:hypothetical protein